MNPSKLLLAATAALLLGACGPGVEITSPGQDDQKVSLNDDGTVSLSIASFGWEIAPAGSCGDREDCGHLHVTVSTEEKTGEHAYVGKLCGTYQEFDRTHFRVDLSACERQSGLFAVLVQVANDDHLGFEGSGVGAHRRFIVE